MSRKINLLAIIVLSVFLACFFYRINKLDSKGIENDIDNISYTKLDNYKPTMSVSNKLKKVLLDSNCVTWNLESLFDSEKTWENELQSFEKDIKELENYVGKATKSKTHLLSSLQIKESLDIRLEKLYAYAKLNRDINKSSYKYLDMIDKVKKVDSKYSHITSDLELEILKLSDSTYNEYLKNNKINKKYKSYLESIRKNKDYYLDEKSEDILSKLGGITTLPSDIYDLFKNMDKKNNNIPSEYLSNIKSYNRDSRKEAYTSEFVAYNDNINTLSGLLIGQVNKNIFYSNVRNYNSALDMYLSGDEVDSKIYDKLIETVNDNTKSLHKYISLRKKLLKLDKVYYYDMFVPLVESETREADYNRAKSLIYSALEPLGEEYEDVLYKAFNDRWIDVYSDENKVGGGYCLSVYKNHPYILLNYDNSIDSVSTLAHELGHGVYEYFSQSKQNYYNSNPSILTHEVASTTNEVLLYEFLIQNAGNKTEKAYYISQYLDFIKDTLFIQTMYAEFEREIHSLAEKGEIINTLVLNDLWAKLQKKYYGEDFEVDPLCMVGWSRIPHFYNSFYVYKYATGCSSAISLSEDILKNGPKNYIDFLKSGSSDKPLNLLKRAGIDLTSEKSIEIAADKFNKLLKELEFLINN